MTDINTKAKKRRSLSRKKQKLIMMITTVFAAAAALIFLMPTVLTIANSFMSTSEIAANYGPVFATDDKGGKTYISETVNLKFIPDMVSFSKAPITL